MFHVPAPLCVARRVSVSRFVDGASEGIRRSAVDDQYRASSEARRRTREVHRSADRFFGFARALQRKRLLRARGRIVRTRPSFADIGVERSAHDAIDAYFGPVFL